MERDLIHFFQSKYSPGLRDRLSIRPLIFGLCFTLSLISCSKPERQPENILSKDDMAKLLTDFYLKEARINTMNVTPDSAKVLFKYFRKKYEKNSGIPDSLIDASYEYYLARPFELSEVYDRIIDSLSLQEQKVASGGRFKK